jgi:cytochrome c
MKGDVAAINAALQAGTAVDASDGNATPLYYAVWMGHTGAAKLLIERGADVNAATKTGGTSLSAAVAKNSPELIWRKAGSPSCGRKKWLF